MYLIHRAVAIIGFDSVLEDSIEHSNICVTRSQKSHLSRKMPGVNGKAQMTYLFLWGFLCINLEVEVRIPPVLYHWATKLYWTHKSLLEFHHCEGERINRHRSHNPTTAIINPCFDSTRPFQVLSGIQCDFV